MTAIHTFESFLTLARESKWSRKQMRSELFALNSPELWARRDELMAALGFATTDQTPAAQQAAAEESKKQFEAQAQAAAERREAERVAREADEAQARVDAEAARLAALEAIIDGAVIYCDGAENTVTRVVNSHGRQQKFDNGGYRAGLKIGDYEVVFFNTKCPDQFAAECWSVLKAVEFATERGLKSCTIRNDRIGAFDAMNEKNMRKGGKAATYLKVAARIAAEHGLAVTFDPCTSAENLADAVVRRPGRAR
jgi:hypothetical protein